MTMAEIDSFVSKFKNLLHCEKNASLSLKTEAGRVHVVLSVELEHHDVFAPVPGFRPYMTRNIVHQGKEDEQRELPKDILEKKSLAMKLLLQRIKKRIVKLLILLKKWCQRLLRISF